MSISFMAIVFCVQKTSFPLIDGNSPNGLSPWSKINVLCKCGSAAGLRVSLIGVFCLDPLVVTPNSVSSPAHSKFLVTLCPLNFYVHIRINLAINVLPKVAGIIIGIALTLQVSGRELTSSQR